MPSAPSNTPNTPELPAQLGKFIWYFLKNYKLAAVGSLALVALSGLWGTINSYLMKYIIDTLQAMSPGQSLSSLLWPCVFLVLNFEVHNLAWQVDGLLKMKYQPLFKNRIISQTFARVQQSAHQFFQENLSGRIAAHIHGLAEQIETIIIDRSSHVIRSGISLLTALVLMFFVHPIFFWILLIWMCVFISVSAHMSRHAARLSEIYAETELGVVGKLVDSLSNMASVRLFARNTYEIAALGPALEKRNHAFSHQRKYQLMLHFFQSLSIALIFGLMAYALAQLYKKGRVTAGDFVLILSLVIEIGYLMWGAMQQVEGIHRGVGRCRNSLKELICPLQVTDQPHARPLVITQGAITFENVSFAYANSPMLFHQQNVTIPAGQKVGLVGYSGGGKSTFINLLLRVYDVTQGRILIDEQDVKGVTQESLRAQIATIPQDPSLFQRTIWENILYARPDASPEQVLHAAHQAYAHDFIEQFPKGYDTLAGERGVNLSGGQRQRIAIARAILKDAPLLILDEVTSQLDSITENQIQESLTVLMQDKTTLVIAHRLSTLLQMDRILVFDKGRIVQDGSHTQLLSQGGLYQELWQAQVGGFLNDEPVSERVQGSAAPPSP